jgi:MFS family permease
MRKIAFLLAAASLFAVAPLANRFGVVASSVAIVWLGVLLALFASGAIQSLSVAAGALGAFGGGVLAPISPAAAGAVLVAAAFAERTTRVRSRTARAVHVLVALVGGALAGSLSAGFATATLPVFGVAIVVASVLAALPLLVEADDPVAHALGQAAGMVSEPAKKSLTEGAELRRTTEDVPLDRATQARVRKTWQSLLKLAEARIRLERSRPRTMIRVAEEAAEASLASSASPTSAASAAAPSSPASAVLGMLDQRIAEHVSVLARAYTAVDTANAATLGLDDTALKTVEPVADSLEEVSRAMVEVKASAS